VSNSDRKNLPEIYDEFARTYTENRGRFDITPILQDFNEILGMETGRLLDLGCGAGEPVSRWFVDRGWEVTGVDFSRGMLQLAQHHVPEMTCIHADMREIRFPPEHFDAVIASYSLFHVPREDHAALFGNILQWLQPGGRTLFTYATRAYTGEDAFDGYREFLGRKLYYSHMSTEQLYATLGTLGFIIESTDYRSIGGEEFLWITLRKPG